MARPSELRRLTRDVPNPKHDKRHRYGSEATAVFKAGAVFRYMPDHTTEGSQYPDPASAVHRNANGRVWDAGGADARALYAASEPYAARTFGDFMQSEGWDTGGFAREVLERLIASGRITLADARAAYYEEMAALDAADAASAEN